MLHNKKRIPFAMLLLCCGITLNSFSQKFVVQLKGAVDSFYAKEYGTRELVIRRVVTANTQGKEELVKVAINQKGFFNVKISIDDSLSYLAFAFEDKKPGSKQGLLKNTLGGASQSTLKEVYLFQAGDSVSVVIKPTVRPYFWGKGSDRLNCESKLYEIEAIHPGLELSDMHLKQDKYQWFALRQDAMDFSIRMRLRLLQAYQPVLPPLIYKMLHADAINFVVYRFFSSVINGPNFDLTTFMYPKEMILDVYTKSKQYLAMDTDTAVTARSGYGADLVFRKDMLKHLLEEPEIKDRSQFAGQTYAYIKKNYSGELRDKLLLIFFETMGRHFSAEVKNLAGDALSSMAPNKYARTLQTWRESQYSAYPFTLYDAKQKVYKLSDYKGKLVVMDFYFSKCGPCIELAKAMKPIHQEYANRKDIVFITVSTDEKAVFMQTLATGVFTDEQTVNLYTNGNGMADPLIKQYDFKGFPRMLVIGKDGTLITSSPPRADVSEENRKAFRQLIDDQLK